LIKCYCCYCK